MSDPVNHPTHYKLFPGQEAIDIIQAALTPEEFRGYLKGNALKYRLRAGNKDDLQQDIDKAEWYRNRLMSEAAKGELTRRSMQIIQKQTADERRMDIVGQNGNDGLHYEHIQP